MSKLSADVLPLPTARSRGRSTRTDARAAAGTVVVIGGRCESLVNFRGDLLRSMVTDGYRVIAIAGQPVEAIVRQLAAMGVEYRPISVARNTIQPRTDLKLLWELWRILRDESPDIVFAYTIKPVVYGLAVSRWAGVERRAALITGIGQALAEEIGTLGWISFVARTLYRNALRGASAVIFQNVDDCSYFVSRRLVRTEQTRIVGGSGVNLERFPRTPLPDGAPVFLMIARLLRTKGVLEYLAAARAIKERHPDARFLLIGEVERSAAAIDPKLVYDAHAAGTIEYLGWQDDVRPYLFGCHVYVLPSYHEGMPRSTQEALAIGRPVITTDATGCKETVIDAANGYMVPVGDASALEQAIEKMLLRRHDWPTMAERSHALARERFDVHRINRDMMTHISGVER